jgi:hypothetical protein
MSQIIIAIFRIRPKKKTDRISSIMFTNHTSHYLRSSTLKSLGNHISPLLATDFELIINSANFSENAFSGSSVM